MVLGNMGRKIIIIKELLIFSVREYRGNIEGI